MTEIQKVKAEIKMLEKKLSFLEELKKTKSPAEEAFRRIYNVYPSSSEKSVFWTDNDEDTWIAFQNGYNASQEDYKVGEYQEPEKRKIDDLAEKLLPDDHPYKIADEHGETNPYKQYLNSVKEWKPSAQTPEQVEEGLRDAMRTAKEEGVFDTTKESWMNKPVEELVEMLEKNPPDCLKFVMGKTLEDIVTQWWCDTFTGTHEKWSMEECIDDLIDQIELFLPRSQSSEGTQSVYTEVAVEAHNELLQKIKSKLRNKK
jgi:hypothetical protein